MLLTSKCSPFKSYDSSKMFLTCHVTFSMVVDGCQILLFFYRFWYDTFRIHVWWLSKHFMALEEMEISFWWPWNECLNEIAYEGDWSTSISSTVWKTWFTKYRNDGTKDCIFETTNVDLLLAKYFYPSHKIWVETLGYYFLLLPWRHQYDAPIWSLILEKWYKVYQGIKPWQYESTIYPRITPSRCVCVCWWEGDR